MKLRAIFNRGVAVLAASMILMACSCGQNEPITDPDTSPGVTDGVTASPDMPPGPVNRQLTIVIDAGHGGSDGGAVGSVTGVKEDGLNLDVAILLKDELTLRGFKAIMTRESGDSLAKTKREDMMKRKEIMNAEGVDMVISVHMNKFGDSSISGPMAFYMQGSSEGEKMAKCIIDALCDKLGHPRRLANPGDYFIIRESKPAAVIIECGFLSNASDEKKLNDPEHRKLLAAGIADGIAAYADTIS